MIRSDQEQVEAVIFYRNGQIERQMLYSEFEAILDGVVPVVEHSNSQAQLVFIRINHRLQVSAAVFFLLSFDAQGNSDLKWNVPVEQLADESAQGPNMGAGPIRLACFSQCRIPWQQKNLWDPDMTPASGTFNQLKKAIAENSLGLVFTQTEATPISSAKSNGDSLSGAQLASLKKKFANQKQLHQKAQGELKAQYESEFRDHMANQLKQQRLRLRSLQNQYQQQIDELSREHQARLESYRTLETENGRELDQVQAANATLKEQLDLQAGKTAQLREYFEHKMSNLERTESDHVSALEENYKLEFDSKLAAATAELKERLQMRDVELMYRNQQEQALRDEIAQLRQENQNLMDNNGDQLLERISQSGVSFIAFQPGAGHISLRTDQISEYLQGPESFAASNCGVSVELYKAWLKHYQAPFCTGVNSDGSLCGESLVRIERPSEFHPGESDCCSRHSRRSQPVLSAVN